jgi:hypothetical protein
LLRKKRMRGEGRREKAEEEQKAREKVTFS